MKNAKTVNKKSQQLSQKNQINRTEQQMEGLTSISSRKRLNIQTNRDETSLKKVLNELKTLKRQVKNIKNKSIIYNQSQYDMTICKRVNSQNKTLKSSSRSLSKSKSPSIEKVHSKSRQRQSPKKEIKQFSFSIQQSKQKKSKKKERENVNPNPIEEQSQESSSQNKNKTFQIKSSKLNKKTTSLELKNIQANQLHEKYVNHFKRQLYLIQIDTNNVSKEKLLKLNIQIGKLHKYFKRIPQYHNQPNNFYEQLQSYILKIVNHINHLTNMINSSFNQQKKIKRNQNHYSSKFFDCETEKQNSCKKCIQRSQEKKMRSIKKEFKKEIYEYSKEISILEEKLYQNIQLNTKLQEEINEFRISSELSSKQVQQLLKNNQFIKYQLERQHQKNKSVEKKLQKQNQTIRQMEEDYNQLQIKMEMQRSKKDDKILHHRKEEQMYKQNEDVIQQLRNKEVLYQRMIQDKDKQLNSRTVEEKNIRNRVIEQFKEQMEDQGNQIKIQKEQISSALEMSLLEINKLHAEIDNLQEVNERYRNKYLKSKIAKESFLKSQEARGKKEDAVQEITQMIQKYRLSAQEQEEVLSEIQFNDFS